MKKYKILLWDTWSEISLEDAIEEYILKGYDIYKILEHKDGMSTKGWIFIMKKGQDHER